MQYQVLARKWRPQNFSELVGQPHVSRTLLNALKSDRVAHAFLFSGPRGSGKTTTARILAKALNCHEGKPGEPCGRCDACVEIAAGNCMDVIEIDAASHGLVDDIRDLMENVRYYPARDRRKIYIIDEAHMISTAGFNALLKTLEEPPPHVVFIMATTEYHKMPATILSRCQQYSFKLIPYDLILERLSQIARAENFQISKAALEQIVFSSGGSMRDAMSALDRVVAFSGQTVRDEDVMMLLDLVEPAVLGETVRAIAKNDTERILRVVAGQVESDRDLQNFCRRLLAHFRNLMVIKTGVASPSFLGIPESLLPDLKEQAGLFSPEDLLRLFDALVRMEADLKHATETRFHLEMGLLELAQISRLRSLEDLIADFNRMVKGEAGFSEKGAVASASPVGTSRFSKAESAGRAAVYERAGANVVPAPAPREAPEDAEARHRPEAPVTGSGWTAPAAAGEPGDDPRRLLLEIAASAQKESLEPILQSLGGARLRGDSVILDLGGANDFARRQLQDNLEVIARAAAHVVGFDVKIVIDKEASEWKPAQPTEAQPLPPAGSPADILERAKRAPVVRAFLEVFPGPVKADKNNV
jgi:DNA polymerase-3 subunit gamma/tau